MPPLRQGFPAHSLMFISQRGPVNPARQLHMRMPPWSRHRPPTVGRDGKVSVVKGWLNTKIILRHFTIRENVIPMKPPMRSHWVHTSLSNLVWPQHLYCSLNRTIFELPSVYNKTETELCLYVCPTFINNCSELWWHLQAAVRSCRMFTRRTIDTKFPTIPVVPHCFQLQEFERRGGLRRGSSERNRGSGCERGEEDRTISAGKRRALVHPLLTVESSVAWGTLAHVAATIVFLPAFPTVETWRVGACQQVVFAVGAFETLGTCAHIAAIQVLWKTKIQKT